MIVLAFKRREDMTPEQLERVRAYDRERSARHRPDRAQTVNAKRFPVGKLKRLTMLYPPDASADDERPRTRGDCVNAVRPCPWVSCHHHLALDVNELNGSIKVVFPQPESADGEVDVDLETMPDTCALDVADRQEATLEDVGRVMNITRERVRQIESRALRRLGPKALRELAAFAGDDATPLRRLATAALHLVPKVTLPPVEETARMFAVDHPDTGDELGDELTVPDEDLEP